MTSQTQTVTPQQNSYLDLCTISNLKAMDKSLNLMDYLSISTMGEKSIDERVAASLQIFLQQLLEQAVTDVKVDKTLLDTMIAKIDKGISAIVNEILHHPDFQQLESTWRGLKYLVARTDFRANSKVEILDVDKETLRTDFEDAPETIQSGLYKQIYVQEYDTPGGEPISTIIADYEFDASHQDISLLGEISRVSAATHCPFISSAGAKFFKKNHIAEVTTMEDLPNYMEKADFIRWNAFRETDDARYVGMTLPRFLLRLPYGKQNPAKTFYFTEEINKLNASHYLWGNACFAFAANIARCFKDNGWMVNIRGPESGGKVEGLPLHEYETGRGMQVKIPTETLIPETRELELANLGFIPLSYYKNSNFACFFSANSTQRPQLYSTMEATANSRINARLPYIFLCSRLAHYLKVIQRENIGANKNRAELENELNAWLQSLVTKMNNPGVELAATHPLKEAKVQVTTLADNPGFYQVSLYIMPHFQVEGVDVKLSLVSRLPAEEK